jgi:hypothetical protein
MILAFPAIVYVLCFLTSAACAFLLGRNYRRTGERLLMWSAMCFLFLAANNLIVIADLVILPRYDLAPLRVFLSLAAAAVLLLGFIWDGEE